MMDFDNWLGTLVQHPGLFMTGTDTDVGKTWVGTQLIRLLQQQGLRVAPRKPVESGWPDTADRLEGTDAWKLAHAAGQTAALEIVCPNRFKAPLSPPRAAELEEVSLSIAELARLCRTGLKDSDFMYVEGAGGFYSPLASDGLNADLAVALGMPVVLVTEDRVGCINHVLLTVEAMQGRGLTVAGVLLNSIKPGPEGMDNLGELYNLLATPIFNAQLLNPDLKRDLPT